MVLAVEPDGAWYNLLKNHVTFMPITKNSSEPWQQLPLNYQHMSDFVRSKALYEYGESPCLLCLLSPTLSPPLLSFCLQALMRVHLGGIYMDFDSIPLKSLEKFRHAGFQVCKTIKHVIVIIVHATTPLLHSFYRLTFTALCFFFSECFRSAARQSNCCWSHDGSERKQR